MIIETTICIIKKDINNNIFNNIINITNLKEMCEKLDKIYAKIVQSIVYSIFQKLLNYPQITKPKNFENHVMSIFANDLFLIKQLHVVIIQN